MTDKETLAAAVARAKIAAGSATKLAEGLRITLQAVSQWDRVPVERVLEVERITGISRYELRPDIYGAPEAAA